MDTPRTRRAPTDDEIPGLLAQRAASGLSIAAFARERGLAVWKLYDAARRATPPARARRKPARKPTFVPVTVISEPQEFELDMGPRGVLRIPASFDAQQLRQLLEVLQGC